MIEKAKNKLSKIQKNGIFPTTLKAFHDHIYNVEHVLLLTRRLDEPFPFRRIRMNGLEIGLCETTQQREELCAAYPDRARFFRDYADQGLHVVTGKVNGKIAGYVWIATKDFYDAHLYKRNFTVDADQVYQFAGFVDPAFRGKPVALIVMNWVNNAFLERGFKRTSLAVSSNNTTSVRFHAKSKYVPTGQAFNAYRLLGKRWSRAIAPRDEALAQYKPKQRG